jgi:UDP-N-acetylenolpyruvoylglucosamine reductase
MNAGAHGASIFDRAVSVEWLMPDGSLHEATREQMHPAYRDCPELHGAIVMSALLRAKRLRDPDEIRGVMKTFAEVRRASQPRERSAGCSFKNPPGDSAGRLIDCLGLKGSSQGGATVSPIHANFITAAEGASASDVETLVRRVRGIVKAETGITLSPEIVFVGKDWD